MHSAIMLAHGNAKKEFNKAVRLAGATDASCLKKAHEILRTHYSGPAAIDIWAAGAWHGAESRKYDATEGWYYNWHGDIKQFDE